MQKLPSHLYGESIFTSTRSLNGKVIFKAEHLNRLFEQVNDYYFFKHKAVADLKAYFDAQSKLEKFAILYPNHAIRMSVFASSRNQIVPKTFSLADLNFELTAKEISPRNFQSLITVPTPYSSHHINIKAGSYFQNFYLKRQAMHAGHDDVLFFNDRTVTEASTSNIIFGHKSALFTPKDASLFSGLGLEVLRGSGLKISEVSIQKQSLKNYDSCYLVNSVNFLTPVKAIDYHTFTNSQFKPMLGEIDLFLRSSL